MTSQFSQNRQGADYQFIMLKYRKTEAAILIYHNYRFLRQEQDLAQQDLTRRNELGAKKTEL